MIETKTKKVEKRLINSRSSSLAKIQFKATTGFHQVPINRMPILIVDSAYKAQKQVMSYK